MNIFRYLLVFSFTLIVSQSVFAMSSLDIEVYGLHQNNTRQITNGDTLFSGDSFQISVKSNKAQNIFVFLKDSNGVLNLLKPHSDDPYSISSGSEFHYPGRDHWYKLDDSIGVETLYFLSGSSSACSRKLAQNTTKENLNSILKNKSCISQELSFNHLLKDLSSLNNAGVRGLPKVSKKDESKILKKYSTVTELSKIDLSVSELYKNAEKIDYQSITRTPPTVRGIKEVHLFKEISPSVVLIWTKSGGLGTGSLINSNGEILTNWHVVKDNKIVGVVFKPSTRRSLKKGDVVIADVLKVDEVTDLALIKVRTVPGKTKAIKFGDSSMISEGEDVHAIGHPQGQNWSYTRGYISSVRDNYEWKYNNNKKHKVNLIIQTQTPINPGNSGGPLLSSEGKLIGVNSFTMDGEGLNYAVSIGDVQKFLKRKSSRKAIKEKTIEEILTKEFGIKVLSAGKVDVDKDGVMDYVVNFDANNNGVIDSKVVTNGKSDNIFYITDKNENNIPESISYDSNKNGKIDTMLIDKNEDGSFDTIARDKNEDGKFDTFTPMT